MKKLILPAAAATLLMASTAYAAPVSPATTAVAQTTNEITQVRDGDRWDRRGYDRRDRRHYRSGHRYDHAPHGYRRYGHRPYDWRTRGCIMVGPVWFCP